MGNTIQVNNVVSGWFRVIVFSSSHGPPYHGTCHLDTENNMVYTSQQPEPTILANKTTHHRLEGEPSLERNPPPWLSSRDAHSTNLL
jgi:hypothetical protein